jgi:hypothetical protein
MLSVKRDAPFPLKGVCRCRRRSVVAAIAKFDGAGLIWSLSVCGQRLGLALLCGCFGLSSVLIQRAVIGPRCMSSYWLSLILQYSVYFLFIISEHILIRRRIVYITE